MSLFKEREPSYTQLPPRNLAKRVATVYDALASQDSWKAKQDAEKERHALAQSEQESADERCQRFLSTRRSRNSKRPDDALTSERGASDASRKSIEGLNAKLHSLKSRLAQGCSH